MPLVKDFFTKKYEHLNCSIRFVNDVIDGIKIYEYTTDSSKLIELNHHGVYLWYNKEKFQDHVIFNKSIGIYQLSDELVDQSEVIYCKYGATTGYNYTFIKEYEANKHLNLFKNKQTIIDNKIDFKLSHFLKYTLGVEFETATGIIPENVCFRDGLIPLRDGSITGNEYSTVILDGNDGLNLLKQQIDTMKEYTYFDKNCSLHIHLGNIKLDPNFIFNVYKICINLQNQIASIVPEYTFKSSLYKNTGKDYCKMLPTVFSSFQQLYKFMVGLNYFGDLHQPHPADITHERKWNIHTRYFFVNFINALCYNTGKTIEFRFLRPSYNLNKIIFWIYIFNAILIAAESNYIPLSLEELVVNTYPQDISQDLIKNIIKCKLCTEIQRNLGDLIGERTDIEDRIFNTTELI